MFYKLYGRKKWQKWHGFNKNHMMAFAQEYRENNLNNLTEAEIAMEKILIDFGFQFFPQKIFMFNKKFRIVDFFIPQLNLAIEVDGYKHFTKVGARYDRLRSQDLRSRFHVRVLRFSNSEVLKDAMYVSCVLNDFVKSKEKRPQKINRIISENEIEAMDFKYYQTIK